MFRTAALSLGRKALQASRTFSSSSVRLAPKDITFSVEARDALMRGVDKLARAVAVTMGPRGRTVLIEQTFGEAMEPPFNSFLLLSSSSLHSQSFLFNFRPTQNHKGRRDRGQEH